MTVPGSRVPVVLDASVGVKWVKTESGTDEALELLVRHCDCDVILVVPAVFVHEVLDVIRRRSGVERAREQWRDWQAVGLVISPIDTDLVESALDITADTGCTLYDAMAPALAERIGAPLYSADRRAHGSLEYARFVG